MPDEPKRCKRCGGPVVRNADQWEIFEHMHWLCFHLEFEHDSTRDADVACADPACPARAFDMEPPPAWVPVSD